MLITSDYVNQNRALHESTDYGQSGHRWAGVVEGIVNQFHISTILDYGAGQCTLEQSLMSLHDVTVISYDPAIQAISTPPPQCELLTCTDVLEHVEPECIDDVIGDLSRLATKYLFLVIPTGPAGKFLPDGRNAHLIQRPLYWWLKKLLSHFCLISLNHSSDTIILFLSNTRKLSEYQRDTEAILLKTAGRERVLSATFDGQCFYLALKSNTWRRRLTKGFLKILTVNSYHGFVKILYPRIKEPRVCEIWL